ncbi:MAG: cupin domain-containing protein [Acidobacteriota bacterium]
MKNVAPVVCTVLVLLLSQFVSVHPQIPVGETVQSQERTVKCAEDSPERRGEEGCTILVTRPLLASRIKPLYWHIDRFDSLAAAKKAAGPDGFAVEAHGYVWLMTVEVLTKKEHHGGHHVARIGPLPIPAVDQLTMRVQSSLLKPGTTTLVHTHSGPEVFYVVTGRQCVETLKFGKPLVSGRSFIVPAGVVHRGRVIGSEIRGALALVLHDSALPASNNLIDNPPPVTPCK